MKSIEQIVVEVDSEVHHARQLWGEEFDRKNTLNDWVSYTNSYLGEASRMGAPKYYVVDQLRKAAGLVISALYHAENDILAPRHYDEVPQ